MIQEHETVIRRRRQRDSELSGLVEAETPRRRKGTLIDASARATGREESEADDDAESAASPVTKGPSGKSGPPAPATA
jgi:hypothetical protein